ncbi:TPA: hypothetical protein L9L57_005045 [Klebsiella pneumoniae]|nr:hypothetical protein [Klebsiella pneumoniae]HBR1477746.1 hypothetical protein [Klebsiella pneumoniae]
MKFNYVLAVAILLAGCDKPAKFDGTSQESLQISSQRVIEQLSDQKRKMLRTAVSDTLSYYETEAIVNKDKNYSSDEMRLRILDGRTADQVIAESSSYRGKREKLLIQYQQK